jgi:hypothetical protein
MFHAKVPIDTRGDAMPRRAVKTAHDYRDPSSFRSKWRERCIVLPEELVQRLFQWHDGQGSAVYALASTGMRQLVSLSMIDAALTELSVDERKLRARADKTELNHVINGLTDVRQYWKEHDARSAGMDVRRYEYDEADYGMTAKLEDEIPVKSG